MQFFKAQPASTKSSNIKNTINFNGKGSVKRVYANLAAQKSDGMTSEDEFSVPADDARANKNSLIHNIPKTQKSNLTIKSKAGSKNMMNFNKFKHLAQQ